MLVGSNPNTLKMRPMESIVVNTALSMTVAAIFVWIYILVDSDEWVMKRAIAYNLDVGLNSVLVSRGVTSKGQFKLVDHMSKGEVSLVQSFPKKRFGMEEFREFMCTLPKIPGYTTDVCTIWTGVQYSSWLMLLGSILGIVFLAVAGSLLYYYAYVKSRRLTRVFFRLFYVLAPCMQFVVTVIYVAGTWLVGEMFPRTGGVIGSSIMFSLCACVLSAGPFALISTMLGPVINEQRNEMRSEQRKLLREARKDAGADPVSSPAAAQLQQQQLQQQQLQQQQLLQQQLLLQQQQQPPPTPTEAYYPPQQPQQQDASGHAAAWGGQAQPV